MSLMSTTVTYTLPLPLPMEATHYTVQDKDRWRINTAAVPAPELTLSVAIYTRGRRRASQVRLCELPGHA